MGVLRWAAKRAFTRKSTQWQVQRSSCEPTVARPRSCRGVREQPVRIRLGSHAKEQKQVSIAWKQVWAMRGAAVSMKVFIAESATGPFSDRVAARPLSRLRVGVRV